MVNIKKVLKNSLIVGSIIIGVSPLLMKTPLFNKQKKEKKPSLSSNQLAGEWATRDEAFILKIHPQPSLSINGTKLDLKLHAVLENELILQDQYGYGITVKPVDTNSLEVFDEAEDKKYTFYKQAE